MTLGIKFISLLVITYMDSVNKIEELAVLFKALSDPTRLKLLTLLLCKDRGNCKKNQCVMALTKKLDVSQSAVSQHLRVLRQTGIVIGDRMGFHVHYSLNKEFINRYKELIGEILGKEFIKDI